MAGKRKSVVGSACHVKMTAALNTIRAAGGMDKLSPAGWLLLIQKFGPIVHQILDEVVAILTPPNPNPAQSPTPPASGG